jgi:hypothetical protein
MVQTGGRRLAGVTRRSCCQIGAGCPCGALVGAAIGAAGGMAGKLVADLVDPQMEDEFWQKNWSDRKYIGDSDRDGR